MTSTVHLTAVDLQDALVLYLASKGYAVKTKASFVVDAGDSMHNGSPTISASVQVEPAPAAPTYDPADPANR